MTVAGQHDSLEPIEKASLDELLDMSATYQAVCHGEADHMEAVAAFFEKRAGDYRAS